MRRLPVKFVRPGMVTARAIYPGGDAKRLPLVAAHVELTNSLCQRLLDAGVQAIFIDDAYSAGIEWEAPLGDEVHEELVRAVDEAAVGFRQADGSPVDLQVMRLRRAVGSLLDDVLAGANQPVFLTDVMNIEADLREDAVMTGLLGIRIGKSLFAEHGWIDYRGTVRTDSLADRMQRLGAALILLNTAATEIAPEIWFKPGNLTSTERETIQRHPTDGAERLRKAGISGVVAQTVAQHHERHDGSGYPKGIAGDEIHMHARIAGLAETCAVAGRRQYGRSATEPVALYRWICSQSGGLFHDQVVEAFQACSAPCAPGTVVRTSDGASGIVTAVSLQHPMAPTVRITHDAQGNQVDFREVRLADGGLELAEAIEQLPSDAEVAV